MIIHFLFMVFAFPVASSLDPNNPYCIMNNCPRGAHTMCLYNASAPSENCERIIRSGLVEREKNMIVNVHNYFRRRVYSGRETLGSPGPQFAAVRDAPLEWDNELAEIAQRWVQQCMVFSDICRNVDRFAVGQNYFSSDFDEDMDEEVALNDLQELVETWYYEVFRYNRNNVRNYWRYATYERSTYHYTQVVWANTTKIGCGGIRYHRYVYPVPKIFVACNYGPSGNIEGEPVYKIDE